jgi:hypothetical protein
MNCMNHMKSFIKEREIDKKIVYYQKALTFKWIFMSQVFKVQIIFSAFKYEL